MMDMHFMLRGFLTFNDDFSWMHTYGLGIELRVLKMFPLINDFDDALY